jgi:hypothetical protein
VSDLLARSRRLGHSAVEALHRADLLLSPAAVARIERDTLVQVLEMVRAMEPREFLVRRLRSTGAATPTDMYHAIVDFLDEYLTTTHGGGNG